MPDRIDIKRTEVGVILNVQGKGSVMGFLSCMLMAKFGAPISVDRLLSPFMNEIIRELLAELEAGKSVSDHIDALVAGVANSIVNELGDDATEADLKMAFYPAAAPAHDDFS